MTHSVKVINQRDLKVKLPKPQAQLHLIDDLLIVCAENQYRTQGFVFALEYAQKDIPERWVHPLPKGYSARFGAYFAKRNLLLLSISDLHTTFKENSYLIAIDVATGNCQWRYPDNKDFSNISAPTIIEKNVFIITDNKASLLSLEDPGQTIWSVDFPYSPHWVYNGITIDESMIYVSVGKHGVICLEQGSGKQQGAYLVPEGEVRFAAAVTSSRVVVSTTTGHISIFEKDSPLPIQVNKLGTEITTGPIIYKSQVVVGCVAFSATENKQIHQIFVLDLTNEQTFQSSLNKPFKLDVHGSLQAPLIVTPEGLLLCCSNDGYLYAHEIETGQQVWQHYLQRAILSQPILTPDNTIITANYRGTINILRINQEEQVNKKKTLAMEYSPDSSDAKESQINLRNFLRNHFSISNLKDLCFEMGINDESLHNNTVDDFTRELVLHCQRNGLLEKLSLTAHRMRPNL
jgi:outer membrane protein assembly factor BamB